MFDTLDPFSYDRLSDLAKTPFMHLQVLAGGSYKSAERPSPATYIFVVRAKARGHVVLESHRIIKLLQNSILNSGDTKHGEREWASQTTPRANHIRDQLDQRNRSKSPDAACVKCPPRMIEGLEQVGGYRLARKRAAEKERIAKKKSPPIGKIVLARIQWSFQASHTATMRRNETVGLLCKIVVNPDHRVDDRPPYGVKLCDARVLPSCRTPSTTSFCHAGSESLFSKQRNVAFIRGRIRAFRIANASSSYIIANFTQTVDSP
ncbi:uncharacterized protein BO95DRAFT_428629 [Aspergillus brunneoviolaceus CBS 621.78]|uniref:Uncharacterized protein n=1 Tax=Aspergillus brunneoviolaceus CBS 621.78 TaxID=1450534 RepID=A0ACD1GIX0_9EURO|nr:hypothetical protein BO95DRAFT_428629 [Aspergillus brunneoviolaceus CBS 621.78]RAH49213.1 hypothetical protein BO95DRAFT_428629 [Aspergillus brunneoviolaceus CBS 621.78]